jgi:hypothetical protein
MIKHFCDQCGVELNRDIQANGCLSGEYLNIAFQVEVTPKEGQRGTGDWCKYCVIAAVESLDDRTKPARCA